MKYVTLKRSYGEGVKALAVHVITDTLDEAYAATGLDMTMWYRSSITGEIHPWGTMWGWSQPIWTILEYNDQPEGMS